MEGKPVLVAEAIVAPFPVRQLVILSLCRICEPIAFMSIFPYIYYMIESFKVTSDEHQIAIYAGAVTSAFAFAEFSTGVLWGKLSDRIGRKPVLLGGMAGTGLSMLMFGLAPSLPIALLARALGGLLNGNIGVIQTTVAEIVTVKEHRPRAFAVMPFVWCLGSIIGASLGGALADPVRNWPSYFTEESIFASYPYLLPNLICTAVVLFGLIFGFLFLEETHEDRKHQRDRGLEMGSSILNLLLWRHDNQYEYSKLDEAKGLSLVTTFDKLLPVSGELSPRTSTSSVEEKRFLIDEQSAPDTEKAAPASISLGKVFDKQVLLCVFSYGILAYHTISFDQLLPVLMSMPESDAAVHLPFRFTGGFGYSTKKIGLILSFQGIYQLAMQLLIFPIIIKHFGTLRTFRFVAFTYPLLYLLTPYLVVLPEHGQLPALALLLVWKVTYQALAYPACALLLTGAAPSLLVLGTINGVAASACSLSRALGPTLSGILQSAGLSVGSAGLAWWTSAFVALVGAFATPWMRECKT